MHVFFLALAAVALILIPVAPRLVRLRINVLKWLHWDWAVNLLERHFDRWVLFFRVILFVIAVMLFSLGWERLGD